MKGRRRKGPTTPEAAALARAQARREAADPASWGVEAAALRLPANGEVTARLGSRGEVTRARRQDLFDRLHARGALSTPALEALRRLQADFARLHRTGLGVRDFAPRVDGRAEPAAIGEARLEAGRRIREALGFSGAASARLLVALCEGEAVRGAVADWREVVRVETGERLADAQGAVIRAAAENLAAAYRSLGRDRRSA